MLFSSVLISCLPLLALAGSETLPPRVRHRRNNVNTGNKGGNSTCGTPGARTFKLTDNYQGKSFFDGWDFFSQPDPTHGRVNFLNAEDAFSKGLAYVQDDNTTVLAVDDTTVLPVGTNRNSVRINSKKTFTGGLFIADFWAMPHGCGTWPAYWTVGPSWPAGGEIDILEGVHNQPTNQYTLHTADGCKLDDQPLPGGTQQRFTSKVLNTECASSNANNAGCAFSDEDPRSYGKGFNINGGGVYAHLWDSTGIKAWNFPRGEIPADIEAKNPDPTTWGTPSASWSAKSCNIGEHFFDHQIVIDTTLCGDWAEGVYPQSGCPGTCAEAVANPNNFKFAKWKINYISVYQ